MLFETIFATTDGGDDSPSLDEAGAFVLDSSC